MEKNKLILWKKEIKKVSLRPYYPKFLAWHLAAIKKTRDDFLKNRVPILEPLNKFRSPLLPGPDLGRIE